MLITSILFNVLTAIYQSFWFSVLLSFFAMFLVMFATGERLENLGYKAAIRCWFSHFKNSKQFRRKFWLCLYTSMILMRTLLNRVMWLNPLSDVVGEWRIYSVSQDTGEFLLHTEGLENAILFVPFIYLMLLNFI